MRIRPWSRLSFVIRQRRCDIEEDGAPEGTEPTEEGTQSQTSGEFESAQEEVDENITELKELLDAVRPTMIAVRARTAAVALVAVAVADDKDVVVVVMMLMAATLRISKPARSLKRALKHRLDSVTNWELRIHYHAQSGLSSVWEPLMSHSSRDSSKNVAWRICKTPTTCPLG